MVEQCQLSSTFCSDESTLVSKVEDRWGPTELYWWGNKIFGFTKVTSNNKVELEFYELKVWLRFGLLSGKK